MYHAMQYLNDEHMRLYEWSGAVTGITLTGGAPEKSKRTHAWRASYSVLALLTTLLILNGCGKKGPAEQAGEQVDQAVKEMKEQAGSLKDGAQAKPGPAEEAGRSIDGARGKAGEKIEQLGEDLKKQ